MDCLWHSSTRARSLSSVGSCMAKPARRRGSARRHEASGAIAVCLLRSCEAPFGNTRGFLRAPALRNSRAKPLKRHGALSRPDGPEELSPEVRELATEFGYTWGGNTDGNNMDECRLATAASGGALRQRRL